MTFLLVFALFLVRSLAILEGFVSAFMSIDLPANFVRLRIAMIHVNRLAFLFRLLATFSTIFRFARFARNFFAIFFRLLGDDFLLRLIASLALLHFALFWNLLYHLLALLLREWIAHLHRLLFNYTLISYVGSCMKYDLLPLCNVCHNVICISRTVYPCNHPHIGIHRTELAGISPHNSSCNF